MAKERFIKVFPEIVKDLEDYFQSIGIPTIGIDWFKKNIHYNCLGGKLSRGLSVVDSYEIFLERPLTEYEYKRAAVLGWSVELLQAFFLVVDDMMDQSKTRRGQPCWYLMPNVGMVAINDSFMLKSSIFFLLKKYFQNESYYILLIENFHEATFKTEFGQLLDLLIAPENDIDLSRFSLEKHSFIIEYKTTFYSFYLPVVLAMNMAGITDEKDFNQARDILVPLGKYFQIQDDFLDCFGDPNITGKIGTDIVENKCTWLINKALEKATPKQRKILEENYGKKNMDSEIIVKKLYEEMGLREEFELYEKESVSYIKELISKVDESRGLKKDIFITFLNKIYKRYK
ncbi:unnamed protein product [Pneumocystis jirovecii]|uniref:Farnesyl pyrophosphate synthase n=2 Tax=Pneumocystis jirovecii TaxID=42068 RepID=L0PFC9_PNEJI|nr:bifunctional (2E,6E)-farnesyl diphosphate synthase/dimethylallyltranstransferase [Pneumocystis jirovecii RU7]KTW31959.1 hypothetical protein T551_00641 [Pneumocystis jirovecii RU7]CCJ30912.1 unnamed protein product [Pneumocystis jirovecii]